MANILTKERIEAELKNNGKLGINGRVVWNACEIPLTKDEHVLAVIDMYDYRDAGMMKIDGVIEPKFYVGGIGVKNTDMDGYVISLFSDFASVAKKYRELY